MNEMIITLVFKDQETESFYTKVVRIEYDTYECMMEELNKLTEGRCVTNAEHLCAPD